MTWIATGIKVVAAGAALYGAYSDSKRADQGIDAQEDQNNANRAFIKEQAQKTRDDAIPLYQGSRDALYNSTQSAVNTLGASAGSQMDAVQQGSQYGQEALLSGMGQFQNAILGMPVDNNALKARTVTPGNLEWMTNPQLPERPMPDLAQALGGVTGSGLGDVKGLTNQEIVAKALKSGLITDEDYYNFQKTFQESGNGQGQWLGRAGSSSKLINAIGTNSTVDPRWRATLEKLYQGIYPAAGA